MSLGPVSGTANDHFENEIVAGRQQHQLVTMHNCAGRPIAAVSRPDGAGLVGVTRVRQ
jgi:hypothetical protein